MTDLRVPNSNWRSFCAFKGVRAWGHLHTWKTIHDSPTQKASNKRLFQLALKLLTQRSLHNMFVSRAGNGQFDIVRLIVFILITFKAEQQEQRELFSWPLSVEKLISTRKKNRLLFERLNCSLVMQISAEVTWAVVTAWQLISDRALLK